MTRQKTVAFLRAVTLTGIYGGLLMPLVFIPIVIFPFVFSKLIAFQILIGLTFPAYLALAWAEPQYRPKYHLLYAAIGAYFVALGLSVMFAVDPARAWWGNQERMNGLFTLLHFLTWLTMAISVLKTWEQWRRLLNFEVVLSMIMAIVALLQKINPNLLLFPASDRVGGLLDNPIYMGAYQIFNLFFLALLFLKTSSPKMRIWYGVIGLFDLGAFFFAQSRGDLLGLAAGMFMFGILYGLLNKNKRARNTTLGLIAIAFLAYGGLFALRNTDAVKHSIFGRLTDLNATLDTRLIAWKIAWDGFLERPLTGWGLDNFHILFNLKYNPQSERFGSYETWFDRSHNEVLDVLAMTGIFGFITYFAIFAALFISVWRAFRKQWIDLPTAAILISLPVAYFVQNLTVFDHPAAFSMSYLLYGLVIAASRPSFLGHATAADGPASKSRGVSWWLFGVLEAAALLVVWRCSVIPFEASRLSIQANNLFMYQPTESLTLAQQAADLPTPYHDEQVFLLSRNLMTVAQSGDLTKLPNWKDFFALDKRLIASEMQIHPKSTHDLFIDAELSHVMASYVPGEAAEAERIYLLAIATSPKRQQLWDALARLYVQEKRFDEAIDIYRKVADFDPESGEGYWNYGVSLLYDKHDLLTGAQQIQKSQQVAYPYHLQDVRETVPLADAYLILHDLADLKKIVDLLPNLSPSSGQTYAELAYKFQQAGLPDERDRVLAFGSQIDVTTNSAYQQILKGTTTLTAPAASSTTSGPRR